MARTSAEAPSQNHPASLVVIVGPVTPDPTDRRASSHPFTPTQIDEAVAAAPVTEGWAATDHAVAVTHTRSRCKGTLIAVHVGDDTTLCLTALDLLTRNGQPDDRWDDPHAASTVLLAYTRPDLRVRSPIPGSVLQTLHETSPWQTAPHDAAWRAEGFLPHMYGSPAQPHGPCNANRWKQAGFRLDEARQWRDLGFEAAAAARWSAVGFSPHVAAVWARHSLVPAAVRSGYWIARRCLTETPDEAAIVEAVETVEAFAALTDGPPNHASIVTRAFGHGRDTADWVGAA